jgi:PASTA domain
VKPTRPDGLPFTIVRRGLSTPAATAAFVSTLLLLGIVGFSAGFVAAGSDLEKQARTETTTSPQASKSPTPSPPPARPTSSPTPVNPTGTPSRPDQFAMPSLVNKDFRVARLQAIALKLGVNVKFNEPSDKRDGTVVMTNPEAGTYVWPSVTIHLHVAGGPPPVTIPPVVGASCEDGKDRVLEAGLLIGGYPAGNKGKVTRTDPVPGTAAKWNDPVKIYCAV